MSLDKYKLFINSFLIVVIIYFSQGVLYPTGSIVSQTMNLFILSSSLYFAIKSLSIKKNNGIVYCLILFISIITFSYLSSNITDRINISAYSNILLALLPFFPFYYISYRGKINEQSFKYFINIMIVIAIARYYVNINALELRDRENIVANSAYLFVLLIPYMFFLSKNRVFYYLNILIIIIFIIQGSKRGALISGATSLLVLFYYQFFHNKDNKGAINLIIGVAGLMLLIKVGYQKLSENEFIISRLQKIDEGDISGRDIIYSNLWNNWYHSESLLNQIFGFGFNSTIEYSRMNSLAHNDWLEIVTNFGAIGVLNYFLFFILIFKVIFNKKIDKKLSLLMLSIVVIWLFRTIFSMSFNSVGTIFLSILMGFVVGAHNRALQSKPIKHLITPEI